MAPLREALTKAGLKSVETYIQSGNVIASSNLTPAEIESLVHEVMRKNFGADIVVLARTPAHFSKILKQNPFKNMEGKKLYFSLLATELDKKLLQNFLSFDFSPDKIKYANNTIYTLYATKHSDSKFNNNYFERKLKITATTRNLNTMTRLVALSAAQQKATADTKKPRD